jgi:LPXTG-motif cell wall-anchored protein
MKFNSTNVIIGIVVIATAFYFLKPTTEGFSRFFRPSTSVDIDSTPKTQEQIDRENAARNYFTTGEKIGIWIGIFVAVGLLGGVGYYFYKRNYRNAFL